MVQASERRGPELPAAEGADRHWRGSAEWPDQHARQAGNPSSSSCSWAYLVACSTRHNSLGESFVSDSDVGFVPLLLQMDHWRMRKRNVRALNSNPILCSYSRHPGVLRFLSFFSFWKKSLSIFWSKNVCSSWFFSFLFFFAAFDH